VVGILFFGPTLAGVLYAAPAKRGKPVHFMERSHIFWGPYGVVFEAQMAPHLFFYNDLDSTFAHSSRGGWSFTASPTPMVRLRMLQEDSNPVRTPSYMPRFDLQALHLLPLDVGNSPTSFLLWGFTFTPFAHHSNGQDGCLFCAADHDGTGLSPCCEGKALPTEVQVAEGELPACEGAGDWTLLNRRNGSFSTNALALALPVKYMKIADKYLSWSVGGIARFETNPEGYLVGAIDKVFYDLYGPHRASLEIEATYRFEQRFPGTARLALFGELIFGEGDDVPTYRASAVAAYEIDAINGWFGGWGPFVRYYGGQDYLNLGFHEQVHYFQVGLTLNFGERYYFKYLP